MIEVGVEAERSKRAVMMGEGADKVVAQSKAAVRS